MATYPETVAGEAAGDEAKGNFARFLKSLGGLIFQCGRLGDIRAAGTTLDDMSDSQLNDIGIRRIGRRIAWHDSRLPRQFRDFEYRSALDHGRCERGRRD